jgi:hypothetical protein
MSRFEIQLEGHPPVCVQSVEEVKAVLGKLHPKGPSFVILSRDDGSYMQTAGARLRLTVEYREILSTGFKHFTLGRKPFDPKSTCINCKCGPITCHQSESMTLADAESIFAEFFGNGRIPHAYMARDKTGEF